MTGYDHERHFIREVAGRLRAEGWQIVTEARLPGAQGAIRADIVGVRPGELLVVEVHNGGVTGPSKLMSLAMEAGLQYRAYGDADSSSVWRTELVASWRPDAQDETAELRTRIADRREWASDADRLFEAFLFAVNSCIDLEERAGIRGLRSPREDLDAYDPAHLVSLGLLGEQDAAALDLARAVLDRDDLPTDSETNGFDEAIDALIARLAQVVTRAGSATVSTEGSPNVGRPESSRTEPWESLLRARMSSVPEIVETIVRFSAEPVTGAEVLGRLRRGGIANTNWRDLHFLLELLADAGRVSKLGRDNYGPPLPR